MAIAFTIEALALVADGIQADIVLNRTFLHCIHVEDSLTDQMRSATAVTIAPGLSRCGSDGPEAVAVTLLNWCAQNANPVLILIRLALTLSRFPM